jgi:long-chain acyl-CoA synthetase
VSECTLPIAMNTPGAVRLGSVGRPLVGNRVKVTKEGELCLKGPGVCEGYWNGGTAFPLDEEGFYHTGDLGRMDGDGFIHIFGRRDDVFKTSTGRKIVPTRLESVYGESPLFERVMATGRGKPFPALLVWLKEPLPTGSEINGEKDPYPGETPGDRSRNGSFGPKSSPL